MLDKLTNSSENLDKGASLKGRKPAKLSTYKNFYPNAKKLMTKLSANVNNVQKNDDFNSPMNVFEKKVDVQNTNDNNVNTNNATQVTNIQTNNNLNQMNVASANTNNTESKEINSTPTNINNTVNFPTTETYKSRLLKLNVSSYNDVLGNIKISDSSRGSRKLKAVDRVPSILEDVLKNVADEYYTYKEPAKEENVEKETFDFSKSLDTVQTKKTDNNVKLDRLDKILNKETGITENFDASNNNLSLNESGVDEVQALRIQKETTEDSLATQKEILENLRKKIEQNRVLCEAKKQELIEENMSLTQQLNDVLAEINQLSDIANKQEALLGISGVEAEIPNPDLEISLGR